MRRSVSDVSIFLLRLRYLDDSSVDISTHLLGQKNRADKSLVDNLGAACAREKQPGENGQLPPIADDDDERERERKSR